MKNKSVLRRRVGIMFYKAFFQSQKPCNKRGHDNKNGITEYIYVARFKGSGHYWYLLKIIISIKPYLVTSNGERLMV